VVTDAVAGRTRLSERDWGVLRGSQHGTLRRLGQWNRDEITFRVEIVFTGFIHYPDLMMFGRLLVGDDPIELSQFQ